MSLIAAHIAAAVASAQGGPAPETARSDALARWLHAAEGRDRLIVSDNLEAMCELRAANEAFDLIYTDPPYNTGETFAYSDRFGDKEAGAAASWIDMIVPRLFMMRDLLSPHGALVIHIDENAAHHLHLALEALFGQENFLGAICWNKRNPKGDSRRVSVQHETILAFARDLRAFQARGLLLVPKPNAERMLDKARQLVVRIGKRRVPDEIRAALRTLGLPEDPARHARIETLETANADYRAWLKAQGSAVSAGEAMYDRIDSDGRVWRPVSMAWPNHKPAPEAYFRPLIHPETGQPCPVPAKGWRNPPDTMARLLEEGRIAFGPDHTTQPQRRYFLDEQMEERLPSVLSHGGSDDALLARIGIRFENPKPLAVAERLITAFSAPGDRVLDPFAGSGTTGHAVLRMNGRPNADSPRRFTLIQRAEPLPERHPARTLGFDTVSAMTAKRLDAALQETGARSTDLDRFDGGS